MHIHYPNFSQIGIDSQAPITINAQIAEQIKLLIAVEELQPGDALPTVAQLAKIFGSSVTFMEN